MVSFHLLGDLDWWFGGLGESPVSGWEYPSFIYPAFEDVHHLNSSHPFHISSLQKDNGSSTFCLKASFKSSPLEGEGDGGPDPIPFI